MIDVPQSVLDPAPAAGTTSGSALRHTTELARRTEAARVPPARAAVLVRAPLRLRAGRPEPLATPEEAAAYPYTPLEREFAATRREGQAMGAPETARRQLAELLDRTAADELMLTTLVYDRVRSYELIAEKVAGGLQRDVPRALNERTT